MPVYQACILVCDGCQAETFGKLVRRGATGTDAIDVLHPPGWKVGGDKAFCPTCPVPVERAAEFHDDVTPVEHRPHALETIERAAIQYQGVTYSVPAPGRHHDVCRMMHDDKGLGDDPETFRFQGFLTSRMRFVDRFEAAVLARAAGQIKVKTGPEDELFSEDVW